MEKITITTTNLKIVNVKCNNINVNLNGFSGDMKLVTALSGLATDEAQASADEGEVGSHFLWKWWW